MMRHGVKERLQKLSVGQVRQSYEPNGGFGNLGQWRVVDFTEESILLQDATDEASEVREVKGRQMRRWLFSSTVLSLVLLCCCPAFGDDYVKARVAIALKLKQVVKAAPAKKKRVIEVWSASWCKTCKLMKADIDAGKYDEYEIVYKDFDKDDPPERMVWLPAMRWDTPRGKVIFPHSGMSEAVYSLEVYKRVLEPVIPVPVPKKTVVRVPLKNLAGV